MFKRNLNPIEGFLAVLFFIVAGFLLLHCCGCRTAKVISSKVNDTTATIVKVATADTCHDSTYISHTETATTVGIPGNAVKATVPKGVDSSFTEKKGNVQLDVYTDQKGNKHINCTADSITLVLKNLRDSISKSSRVVSVASADTSVKQKTLTEVVKEQQDGWWLALWKHIRNVFAIIGIAAIVFFILWILKRA